jgi:rhamnose utilization protein RhaD (predicted bifunctional aldolase and dehydrogenase)/NAD(P)-dependent dehydrogenase (short-subunit alcohol dehydrogenase family)
MKSEIDKLIEVSNFYGRNKDYVIAGGGNASFKNEATIWIKASGQALADVTEKGLVALNRTILQQISLKKYSEDPVEKEEQVKSDLSKALIDQGSNMRPSVETSLHDLIKYKFIVHVHPTLINGILCSHHAKKVILQLFGEKVLFVPYTNPGYTLFKKLESELSLYRQKHENDPQIIFLENHGVFVSAETTEEIKIIYANIISKISGYIKPLSETTALPYNNILHEVLPAIRMILSEEQPKVIRFRHNSVFAGYYKNQQEFNRISLPLTPDMITYCKTRFIYIEQSSTSKKILESFKQQLENFIREYNYPPKIVIIKDMGVIAIDDSYAASEAVLDIYEDLVKVSYYASLSGGPKFLNAEETAFIDQWEVETYRRKIAQGSGPQNKIKNKTAVVTGSAQGFGAGIAAALYHSGVNVVIADLNEEAGKELSRWLNETKTSNHSVFVKTDVSDPLSVKNLLISTISEFGGIDIMVSNAGILLAGGLDELEPDIFSKMTDVNYNGYFHCAKYAAEVMKIQNQEKPDYFTDIIQINSKSGLRGSKRNFAYSGAKFGGIGLTQSFALELAPFRIKVNSICPGNFFEGPLWSDPKNGLFVQYLNTGKVPGAKNIEDVRRYYEDQVPLKRGCKLEDVMKALTYIIDQEYETGQAFPVTGGQVMLG